jgi:hypothetical protein
VFINNLHLRRKCLSGKYTVHKVTHPTHGVLVLKSADYWIIIGLNNFVPLDVKTGIIYLISGQLKGVKVI